MAVPLDPITTVTSPEATNANLQRFESIEQLFAALESSLLSYALRLLGERAMAEDMVQEAFVRLHAQFDQVQEPRRWPSGGSPGKRCRCTQRSKERRAAEPTLPIRNRCPMNKSSAGRESGWSA